MAEVMGVNLQQQTVIIAQQQGQMYNDQSMTIAKLQEKVLSQQQQIQQMQSEMASKNGMSYTVQ